MLLSQTGSHKRNSAGVSFPFAVNVYSFFINNFEETVTAGPQAVSVTSKRREAAKLVRS